MNATTYESIFGWTNFTSLYLDMIMKYDNTNFCEIGCFKGKSTVFMGEKIKEVGKNINVIAVDLWPSPSEIKSYSGDGAGQGMEGDIINEEGTSLMQEFIDNLNRANLRDTVFPIRSFSTHAAKLFPDEYFSFIFVDAGHSYQQVMNDLEAWYPKVKQGGTMAGHDYYGNVHKAVNDFFMPGTIKAEVDRTNQDSWIWEKK